MIYRIEQVAEMHAPRLERVTEHIRQQIDAVVLQVMQLEPCDESP
ncbi:MAG: hypothetical protein VKL39_08940 [Leptolyngbyaceae bacterium]|nr:hypothetical protein [Leptolyngbyaceae bacterium]